MLRFIPKINPDKIPKKSNPIPISMNNNDF